ncbi:MAG TPA: hypothetical protein VK211_02690 [Kamptonema sp.]|nr:hypothetical protein [Kamptonema sp.]
MNSVKITAPVIRKREGQDWYQSEGQIQVVYESTDLAQAVVGAKEQANKVLEDLGAECLLVKSLQEIEGRIKDAELRLERVKARQEKAQHHFDALMNFLGKFGVDGTAYRDELRISAQPILEAAASNDDDDDDDDDA